MVDYCISCGAEIPEGRLICVQCEESCGDMKREVFDKKGIQNESRKIEFLHQLFLRD